MAYDLGDTVPLGVDVVDEDGVATAAGTITLTIDLPDGTTVTPTLSSPSTGRYEHDYVSTQPGRHGWRVVSTTPATAFADVFDVRAAAPRYLISLADAKRNLNMSAAITTHDEELRGHIEAATEAIEAYLGETVVRLTETETRDLDRATTRLVLGRHPVVSLTSVESLDGATTWDVADLAVDGSTGLVRVVSGSRLCGTVVITYVAGRSQIPANYARAAEIVVANLYEAQRSPGAGPPAGPLAADEQLDVDAYGVAMTPRVRELLGSTAPLVA